MNLRCTSYRTWLHLPRTFYGTRLHLPMYLEHDWTSPPMNLPFDWTVRPSTPNIRHASCNSTVYQKSNVEPTSYYITTITPLVFNHTLTDIVKTWTSITKHTSIRKLQYSTYIDSSRIYPTYSQLTSISLWMVSKSPNTDEESANYQCSKRDSNPCTRKSKFRLVYDDLVKFSYVAMIFVWKDIQSRVHGNPYCH